MINWILLSAILMLCFPPQAIAQNQQTKQVPDTEHQTQPPADSHINFQTARLDHILKASRIHTPIVADGKLSEEGWALAEPGTNFIQVQPYPGQPAIEQTEIRILYDEANLYIGATCLDTHPDQIRVSSLQRDFSSNNTDLFGIVLDTLNDRQSGFSFWVNPAGARRETQISMDGERTDAEWEGVWSVKTSVDEKGWVAEIVIPFKTLRFSDNPHQEWGFNAVRRTRRTNEDSTWTPLPLRIGSITRVSWAGRLVGLEDIRQGRNLKVKPFVIGSGSKPGPDRSVLGDADAGIDVKFGFTPKVTLDVTYRTDFSQVEADDQQVNLTRFNLFFPEKREFFLENQGIFNVTVTPGSTANVIPFFSRRIGLSREGTPIPLVGGTRLTGQMGSYDVGVVAMKTEDYNGVSSNNFLVGRVRKTLPGMSTIGAVATSRDSAVTGDFNRLYGVDSRFRFFGQKLDIVSYLMATDTPTRSGRSQARLLGAAWRDDRLTWRGQYEMVDRDFNPEMGFVRRAANTHMDTGVLWEQRTRSIPWLRNYLLEASSDHFANPDGDPETRVQTAGAGLVLQNGSEVKLQAQHNFERLLQPFAIRPTVRIATGDYDFLRYTLSGNTDLSRAISGRINMSTGEFWDGTSRAVSGSMDFRPNHHLSVSATLNYTTAKLPAGDFSTTIIGTRVFYGFTSNAFLSSFVQYNSATSQFSSNTRFNLIHRPLSDLFVVYNERRSTFSDALIDRALIVKFTNLFDF